MTPTETLRDPVRLAHDAARRLGHSWVGAEHLLFALCASDNAAGRTLRAAGLIPVMIWADIRILVGLGPWAVDRDALAAIGIDLDEIMTTMAETMTGDSLTPPSRRRRARPGHIPPNTAASRCLKAAAGDTQNARSADHSTALTLAVLTSDSQTVARLLRRADVDLPRLIAAFSIF